MVSARAMPLVSRPSVSTSTAASGCPLKCSISWPSPLAMPDSPALKSIGALSAGSSACSVLNTRKSNVWRAAFTAGESKNSFTRSARRGCEGSTGSFMLAESSTSTATCGRRTVTSCRCSCGCARTNHTAANTASRNAASPARRPHDFSPTKKLQPSNANAAAPVTTSSHGGSAGWKTRSFMASPPRWGPARVQRRPCRPGTGCPCAAC